MSARAFYITLLVGAGTVVVGMSDAFARQSCDPLTTCAVTNCTGNSGTTCCKLVGPDVIVGEIQSSTNYTLETVGGVQYDAFSFGTTSCNVGNQNVRWNALTNNLHPAIAQGLYKYKAVSGSGRFEQIGQSWLKHGFTALTDNACGCRCSGSGGSVLGVGCSDPYTAGRNGTQSGMGPKWQVDASAGYFPATNPANPAFSGSTARRLRCKSADIEPSSVVVRYFAECQYVTQDDAAYGNKNNNTSYRECSMSGGNGVEATVSVISSTQRMKAAINAWLAVDPSVLLTNVTTVETNNPSEYTGIPACCTTGLVIVGFRATDLGGGITHYEYAVQNVNSDRSIASFSVPLSGPITITNVGFHDVDYHSSDGESSVTRDGTDWPSTVTSTAISWATTPFASNTNANALRWGTMYNFRFDANTPVQHGQVTLGTWKVVGSLVADTFVPTPIVPPACPTDENGDGVTNVTDLLTIINAWGPCPPPCPPCPADENGDCQVNVVDMLAVINAWGPCP